MKQPWIQELQNDTSVCWWTGWSRRRYCWLTVWNHVVNLSENAEYIYLDVIRERFPLMDILWYNY